MRWQALVAAALVALGSTEARAQPPPVPAAVPPTAPPAAPPDRWDVARAPEAARNQRVLDAATDKLEEADATRSQLLRQQLAHEARSLLEQLGGGKSADERVRYLYGHALHLLDDDAAVIAALAPLVGAAFDHPLGIHVMFDLAIAYAKIERFRDEVAVYGRLLDADTGGRRATFLLNRGESRAELDDFAGSVEDFRRVIAINPSAALPRWGLALTLDRWGDLSQALEEGGRAWDLDHGDKSILDDGSVFFVPAYKRWWYHALRQLSAAQRAQVSADKLAALQHADQFYELYLAQAPSTDRWVPLARARRKMIEARITALRKQMPREKAGDRGRDPSAAPPRGAPIR